jgi:hypothetical protein
MQHDRHTATLVSCRPAAQALAFATLVAAVATNSATPASASQGEVRSVTAPPTARGATSSSTVKARPPKAPDATPASKSVPPKAPAPASTSPATAPPVVPAPGATQAAALEQARLTLGKWIETQQIISRERNDWSQAKEILQGRVDLIGREVGVLTERIAQTQSAITESDQERATLTHRLDALKNTSGELDSAVAALEERIRTLLTKLPDPLAAKLLPLVERMPVGEAVSRISTAERFQNVLGILNELNRANSEITVSYEVRKLDDGSSTEVQVIYIGLAQGYYLSPRGDAGVGRPGADGGWVWTADTSIADEILLAIEVIQGKHPPTFVPLPLSIQ